MADADLGDEGRGDLDRLLAGAPRDLGDPLAGTGARDGRAALARRSRATRCSRSRCRTGATARAPWTLGLDVLPASLLVIEFAGSYTDIGGARLYGGEGALRTFTAGLAGWRAGGRPRPPALALRVEPHRDRSVWSIPYPDGSGGSAMTAARTAGRCASRPR